MHDYKFRIWDYPRILILHVDRFSEEGLEVRVKENAPMFGAKEEIDIASYKNNSPIEFEFE